MKSVMATEHSADAVRRPQRLQFLDAARASAMLFVLLDHFGQTFFVDGDSSVARWMAEVGMVATPTFVAISGILVGFLHRSRGADFQRMRVKLVDRGLFLLLWSATSSSWAHT
jgi:uncharacterized membrane protein